MKNIMRSIEIPETRKDFHSMPLFQQEYNLLNNAWNVNVTRRRIKWMDKVDQPKAEFVLQFFIECGAMTYTLMQMPLKEYRVNADEVITNIEEPFGGIIADMYKCCRYYSKDWHSRDIQMFPIEHIEKHPNMVRELYKKLLAAKVDLCD